MSKRFGRSHKRKARAALAAMTAERDGEFNLRRHAERVTDAVRGELAEITQAINDVVRHSAALPIETIATDGNTAGEWRSQRFVTPGSLLESFGVVETTLHKLRMKAVRDELQKGLVVRAEYRDRRCEFFMTQEALDYSRVREAMALELCRRVMHEFSRTAPPPR